LFVSGFLISLSFLSVTVIYLRLSADKHAFRFTMRFYELDILAVFEDADIPCYPTATGYASFYCVELEVIYSAFSVNNELDISSLLAFPGEDLPVYLNLSRIEPENLTLASTGVATVTLLAKLADLLTSRGLFTSIASV
jgi:hypothetical protein